MLSSVKVLIFIVPLFQSSSFLTSLRMEFLNVGKILLMYMYHEKKNKIKKAYFILSIDY